MQAKVNTKNFIRYDEGAERYSMSKHSFMKLAQDARAVYKINRITLVNVKIFESASSSTIMTICGRSLGMPSSPFCLRSSSFLLYPFKSRTLLSANF